MFNKTAEQRELDQQQLIKVLTNNFNQHLLGFHDENAELGTKLAVLEEQMVNNQTCLLNKNVDRCSLTAQGNYQIGKAQPLL